MTKINLHELFAESINQITENDSIDKLNGYTAALNDAQACVDELEAKLARLQGKVDGLVETLKECDYFCQDQKARANQAIATDCPDCDYQCVGCIHSIDDCDSTSLKIRKALAEFTAQADKNGDWKNES